MQFTAVASLMLVACSGGGGMEEGVCQLPTISSSEEARELVVRGSAMDASDGQVVRVVVSPPSGASPVLGIAQTTVVDGGFEFVFPEASVSYTGVAVYYDVVRDNSCKELEELGAHVTTSVTAGTDVTVEVCGVNDSSCRRCPGDAGLSCYEMVMAVNGCSGFNVDVSNAWPCP